MSTTQVAFRLEQGIVDEIDDEVARLRREHPGIRGTRADAARALLTLAILVRGPKRRRCPRGCGCDSCEEVRELVWGPIE